MLLSPKSPKFIKSFTCKRLTKKLKTKNVNLNFSGYCLKSESLACVTNFHLESFRRFLRIGLRKTSQIFFRIYPNSPITKKPKEIRLGCGKGNLNYWCYFIKKNEILVEISNTTKLKQSMTSLKNSNFKLPNVGYKFDKKTR